MMRYHISHAIALLLLGSVLFGCTTVPPQNIVTPNPELDRAELISLNEELAWSQIVKRDPKFISEVAVQGFRVLAPGGLIENKKQVLAGLSAWNATNVKLTGTEIVFHGSVAIVMGRMDIDGEMRPVGRWGPLKYMSTWVREDAEWRLLSRSLTPCLDVLIKMGRC